MSIGIGFAVLYVIWSAETRRLVALPPHLADRLLRRFT